MATSFCEGCKYKSIREHCFHLSQSKSIRLHDACKLIPDFIINEIHQLTLCSNSSIFSTRYSTLLSGSALYKDALKPPTDRWPLMP